ncbi:MAG: hypothetical protein ABSF67_00050 [Roseiarcus sp.]|jgi:hypothetical protein
MSVADCIARALAAGKIDQPTADSALQMHQRMQREFTAETGPASADAAAALAAAKALRASAAEKVRNATAQVTAFRAGEQRLAEHPMGRLAGLMGMITRDIWRDAEAFRSLPAESAVKSGVSIEGKYNAVVGQLYRKFSYGMEKLKPGFFGMRDRQLTAIDNVVRELKGVDTGDEVARAAAKGFKDAADYAMTRAQQGGRIFNALEDWALPQFWRAARVGKIGFDEFKRDIVAEADRGALTIFDRDTGRPVTMADRDKVLDRAYRDITSGGGSSAPFAKDQRTFNFGQGKDGADAWLKLQKKYGPGENIMSMLAGHLDRMAHEVALTETFGPSYEANFRALLKSAGKADIPTSAVGRLNPARLLAKGLENRGTVEGAWKVATGQAHPVHDDFVTGALGGLRAFNTASSLGRAVLSVLPTDTVTQLLAANHVGMNGFGHVASIFSNTVSKADAAHLSLQAHNLMDYVNGVRDYADHVSLLQATGKLASGVVKATGLEAWAKAGRRTWAGDMLNLLAGESGKSFDQLAAGNPALRRFLDQYGFTAKDWDSLRGGAKLDLGGARYLDPNALMDRDRGLYERTMNAIQEQSAYAFHQPDYRLRGIESGAAAGASGLSSELWRTLMQFKTFALSRMTTQMMRVLTDGSLGNRVTQGLAFLALSTGAGAVSLQAHALVSGKTPERMDTPGFWARAMAMGGVAGLYGDLLDAALRGTRGAGDVMAALGGPAIGMATNLLRLGVAPVREEFDPQTQNVRRSPLGREVVSAARTVTPNTWYTRLAVDRLLWDKLQTLVDPDYRQSFARAQRRVAKDYGQGYWWQPGATAPGGR